MVIHYQDQDQPDISWDHVPEIIKRHIIGYNPSLRKLHNNSLKPSLDCISQMRRDKQCVYCVRSSIFTTEISSVIRKPSLRMYLVTLENYSSSPNHIRVRCMCKEHFKIETGEICITVPRNVEYPSHKFKPFVRSMWSDVSSLIMFFGVDEDDLIVLSRNGTVTPTMDTPRPTWKRYVFND